MRVGILAAAGCLAISLLVMPLMLIAGPGLGGAKGDGGHAAADHAIASGSERFDDLAVMIVAAPLLYALGGFILGMIAAYVLMRRARAHGAVHIDLA